MNKHVPSLFMAYSLPPVSSCDACAQGTSALGAKRKVLQFSLQHGGRVTGE